ncbi:MAG: hypothetical protein IPG80_18475 [Anaerolineales bacterium]|uniref:hypothetical protein n=1 Tax=Candidatus Villigracilis vicinus TaxID=3140679 RepID=UPI0031355CBC|nr:hypothetical protein [Anaerolineales bacterium]
MTSSVMPADGGKPRKFFNITPLGAKFFLVFSPDGKWLAYLGTEGETLGLSEHEFMGSAQGF